MSDYVVAVGFETDASKVKRETDALAGSVDNISKSQDGAAKSTKDLTSASSQLESIQRLITIRTQKLAEATTVVTRMQARGVTGSKEYTAAIEKQLTAQDRLASSLVRAEKLQSGGGGSKARPDALNRAAAIGGGVITGAAIGKVVTDSIQDYSRLNGAVQDSRDVFGSYTKDIDAFGKTSASAIGQSRLAITEETNDLGTLFRTLQVGQQESAKMSVGLVRLSSDLGALSHEDPTTVFAALKGALSGQYDSLQKYNVVLTTANVRQEAVRLGLAASTTQVSQSAQAQAAYSLIIDQTKDRQGAFGRSTDEAAKQQAILTAKVADAKLEIGKGLLPAMIGLSQIADGTLVPALTGIGKAIAFVGSHDSTRKVAELFAVLYGATKVVDLLAAAWGRVAVAASGAAAAETLAARTPAKGPGVAVGVGGILTKAGTLAGGGRVGTGLATLALFTNEHVDAGAGARRIFGDIKAGQDPTGGPSTALAQAVARSVSSGLTDALIQARARIEGLNSAQASASRSAGYASAASRDPRALAASAAAQPLPGLTDALPSADVDLTALRAAVTSARQGLRVAQTRTSSGGGGASAAQIASAEAAVASARAAARKPGGDFDAEQARLRAAEAHLTELRQGGNRTAAQAVAGEKSLADARERLRKANEALTKGEEDLNGLSAKSVLARADASKGTSEAEVRNVRRLVGAGLTYDVIEDLKKLETTAPGTIANVAKALTPAYVKQLNHDAAARRVAAQELASLGGQSVVNDGIRRARELAKEQAQAYKDALAAAIKDPTFRAELQTDLGRLLTPGGVPGIAAPSGPLKPAAPSLESLLFPTVDPRTIKPTPRAGLPRDASLVAMPTQAPTTTVVHLSEASAAAVGNHVRAGGGSVSQHTNVFPNVSNFPAAINEAERRERRSRIMGG